MESNNDATAESTAAKPAPLGYATSPLNRPTWSSRLRQPLLIVVIVSCLAGVGASAGYGLRGLALTYYEVRGVVWMPSPDSAGVRPLPPPDLADQMMSPALIQSCLDDPAWPGPRIAAWRVRRNLNVFGFRSTSIGIGYYGDSPHQAFGVVTAIGQKAAERIPGVVLVPDAEEHIIPIEPTWPTWTGATIGGLLGLVLAWLRWRRRSKRTGDRPAPSTGLA